MIKTNIQVNLFLWNIFNSNIWIFILQIINHLYIIVSISVDVKSVDVKSVDVNEPI